ncbi:MAG: TonB C-terminal domain-containing protein, partial [Gammaproteobacteria bacterium]|nr:TonB C-terminal domain-containing protein [Gammaproteobacteria bacterium]
KRLAEEERQRYLNSSRMKKLRSQYVRLIERHVEKKWIKPASTSKDMFCEVIITQNRAGTVLSVKTEKCKGDKAFQQSVERAVLRASPLPDPPSPDVFDRTVLFTFSAG